MKNTFLVLSFFLMIGCTKEENPKGNNNNTQPTDSTFNPIDTSASFTPVEIRFIEVGKGELYGDYAEGIAQSNLVITDNTTWQNLLTRMNTVNNVTDIYFSETDIDFNRYMILAVFLDIKGSGWEVTITKVTENQSDITVHTEDEGFINSVVTQPFHIVKIPIKNKPVVFVP